MTENREATLRLLRERRWTEFLASLPAGASSFVFGTPRDIESCQAVAWRLNARGESGRRYSFTTNYAQRSAAIVVTPEGGENNG